MKQRTNQILFDYWNELRAGRLAPRRFEIEPSRITGILSETFILERVQSESFRYRLAGTRICEIFGTEFRSRGFFDGWDAADSEALLPMLHTMCTQGAVLAIDFEATSPGGKSIGFECIMMPLAHAGQTVTRVLGAMTATSTPSWLGYEPLTSRRLLHRELIWPDGRPHAVAEKHREVSVFAKALDGARYVHSERRRFRVLDGGLSGSGPIPPPKP
jgi:hypothetical protein